MPARPALVDSEYLREQRHFRRLEVSLPIWISTAQAHAAGHEIWELGYTRDISLGGAKIVVPPGEEQHWRAAAQAGLPIVVRFADADAKTNGSNTRETGAPSQIIAAWPRHVEAAEGGLMLGVQFDVSVARGAREAALRRGFATVKNRRKWQGAFALSAVLAGAALLGVNALRIEVEARDGKIKALQAQQSRAQNQLELLSKPILAVTKSAGIDREWERQQVQTKLEDLKANMARLNDPINMKVAIAQREKGAQQLGLSLRPASTGARVQLAVAFPYGYNWPLVVGDLESALGRKIPHIVTFQDWSAPFPDLDAREARARGKTLQITWEPWHFADPSAIQLSDIIAGKHDKYIDGWASGARGFGGELWLRWGHEMNGNWYPWSIGNNGGDAQIWVKAYRHIHDRFRKMGASNVRWVWCFNAQSVPDVSWNQAARAYPGDDYVDAVAVDGYNFGTTTAHSRWQSFDEVFARPVALANRNWPAKPLWIGETGCSTAGGDKVAWLRQMDAALRGPLNRVESVTWFEAAKEADWRVMSSLGSAQTARQIWSADYYKRGE